MPNILTPEEVAECKAKTESEASRHPCSKAGCDECTFTAVGATACSIKRRLALCATIETLRATLAAKEETQRALEDENAALMGVVRELADDRIPDDRSGVWAMVPMSLILRARELSR